ncbi:RNA polymerase sigma factor [Planctomycetota bacterium]
MKQLTINLLKQAQQGDSQSSALLTECVQPAVYAFVHRSTMNHHLSEDLCQETLLEMTRALPTLQFPHEKAFWAWIYKVAYSKIQLHFRQRGNKRIHMQTVLDHDILKQHADSAQDSGLERMISQELQTETVKALNRLRLKERSILALRCYDNLSYAEIAKVMDIPLVSAKVAFYRAKQSLKRQLQRSGFDGSYLAPALGAFAALTRKSGQATASVVAIPNTVLNTTTSTVCLSLLISKLGLTTLLVVAVLASFITPFESVTSEPPVNKRLPEHPLSSLLSSKDYDFPARLLGVHNPQQQWFCWGAQNIDRPWRPVLPAPLAVGEPSHFQVCLVLPKDRWIELAFAETIPDGPGPDILIPGWHCRELELTLTTANQQERVTINCQDHPDPYTITTIDLADTALTEPVQSIRILSRSQGAKETAFKLAFVKARQNP